MRLFIAILGMLLMASCATKFSLQKRKYNQKGFYFASSSGKSRNNKKQDNPTTRLTQKNNPAAETALTNSDLFRNDSSLSFAGSLKLNTEKSSSLKSKATSEEQTLTASASRKTHSFSEIRQLSQLKENFKNQNFKRITKKPFELFSGGMNPWGIIGVISAIVGLILAIYYLFIMFAFFAIIFPNFQSAIIFFVIVLIIVAAIGAVIILNSD